MLYVCIKSGIFKFLFCPKCQYNINYLFVLCYYYYYYFFAVILWYWQVQWCGRLSLNYNCCCCLATKIWLGKSGVWNGWSLQFTIQYVNLIRWTSYHVDLVPLQPHLQIVNYSLWNFGNWQWFVWPVVNLGSILLTTWYGWRDGRGWKSV